MKPILVTNIVAMVLFSMAVCFTKDIVTSKVRGGDVRGGGAKKLLTLFSLLIFSMYKNATWCDAGLNFYVK